MSGTNEDRPQGPIWIAQRMEGDEVKFLRRATDEDVSGQAYKWSLSQTEEDVEGQSSGCKFLTETGDDIEGQLWKNSLAPTEDDTEGEFFKNSLAETDEDVSGRILIVTLDASGDLDLTDSIVRMRANGREDAGDDVKGESTKWGG